MTVLRAFSHLMLESFSSMTASWYFLSLNSIDRNYLVNLYTLAPQTSKLQTKDSIPSNILSEASSLSRVEVRISFRIGVKSFLTHATYYFAILLFGSSPTVTPEGFSLFLFTSAAIQLYSIKEQPPFPPTQNHQLISSNPDAGWGEGECKKGTPKLRGWSVRKKIYSDQNMMNFQQFRANYELKEVLGHGSHSTVRKVIRRDTQNIYAAKIYQSYIVQARHEMDMLIKLEHPNIVNIYEVYEEDNCFILILDYMAGGQLYDQISQRKRFTETEVRHNKIQVVSIRPRNYIRILIDAVRYCHETGVIHRDIKPQNLLLTTNGPDGILKLSDFGISKIFTNDQLNTICGTPIYMAPEIWKMESYNEKVDIWSIGVVAYYLLSGEYPFFGDNTQELLKSVCFTELSFKHQVWESVSGRALVFLREALNKEKAMRPSAADLLESIWFLEPIPSVMSVCDPNLGEAIVGISREKIKTKKIRKEREVRQIFKSSQLSQVRFKFLTFKEIETHQPSDMEGEEFGII